MTYRELVKRVQHYSGFSDQESETALTTFLQTLCARLMPAERKDLASQLPQELQPVFATTASPQRLDANSFLEAIQTAQDIDEPRAKKQMYAAWLALKDAVSEGELDDVRAQLPPDLRDMLH